ncbi:MAG: nucleotide exchange factor GrpE [Planctomycetota bacterium]|jgi:molecular chaperone GrpE
MAKAKKGKKNQPAAEPPLEETVTPETGAETAGETDEVDPELTAEYWQDKFLRAQADIQNIRRRMMEETEDRVRLRLEALLHDLIRVSDYMEAALGSIPAPIREAEQADAFLAGIHAIQQALEGVMLGHGMTFVAPGEDHDFDPDEHEAVENIAAPELEKPRLELLSRGYRMGKRILRPAKLRIHGPEDGNSEDNPDQEEA